MYLFNTLEVGGRTWSAADITGIKTIYDYGLNDNFYGGRIKRVGTTNSDLLLLVDANMKAIDTAAESLENIPLDNIRFLLNSRKIKFHHKAGRDKLIALLEGREVADE